MTCTIRNLSATGASMEGASLIRAPDIFRLVLEMESTERLCTVVWRKKAQIGVRFSPIPATTFGRPDGMD
jgi:hypothetical protein